MKVINRMLRLREVAKCLFVFCIFSFCVNGINAQSVVIDNLLYEVVNLTEASVKANSKDMTSANILEKVEIEGVEYAVTSIKDHAFNSCKNLTSVSLHNGVISIGYAAFSGCSKLESISLPETLVNLGNEVFWQCTSLTSITIPNGITSIGDLAFYYCGSLQSVSFSDNLTSIGEDAFGSCTSLTSIEFPEKLNYIGGYAYAGCSSLQYITVNSPTPPQLGERPFGYPSYETLILTVPKGTLSAYQSAEIWKKFGFIREKGAEITDGLIIEKDGIYYKVLSAEEKTLETTFAGETYDEVLDEYKGDVVIPNVVNYENVEFTVVAIGESTFARCKNLKSVFLPNGIKSIRASAFSNCSSLSDIQLPEELTTIENQAFLSCTSLSNISLPISLTTIGSHAFLACPSLTSIEIPSKVTVINFQTFEGCTSLNHVVLPKDILTIDNRAFAGCSSLSCITIKNTVPPTVYEQTFSTFDTTELIVPVGTKSAYQSAEIWKNFKTIREEGEEEIADGSRFEKDGVFYKVLSADAKTVEVTFKGETYSEFTDEYTGSVVIPQTVVYEDEIYSVVEIGEYAFHNCPSLKSVSLPKNLSHIRKRAFYGCSSLSSVSLSSNLNTIGERAFYSCSSLASINLPNSVTFIDERAFYECSSLASVVLPTGLTELSAWTFGHCTNLKSVTLNEKLNTIGDRAFSGCESIAKLILPESIETIGSYAFYNCKSLSSLTLEGSVPPAANDNSFDTYETTVLTVPFGSKSTYQTASVWKNFSNIRENSEIVDGYKFEVGGIFYKIISASDKTVEVTYKGESFKEYADEYKGEVVIPAVVSYSNIKFSVTAIGISAFNGCAGVTSVEIPETVTSIKLLAFDGCSGLVSVVLNSSTPPNALASSFNTYETTVLTVPFGSKSTYQTASVWKNFSNIREDSEIVDGYKFEVEGIFYKIISASDKTVEVTFKGESFKEYTDEYKGEVVIPAVVSYSNIKFYVTAIGISAFNGCAGVTSVEIPETVTSIKLLAFNDCSGLVSVVLNSSTPPNALASSFNTYETTALTVPAGSKSAYLASSVWKNFISIKEEGAVEITDGYRFEKDDIYYRVLSAEAKTVEVTYSGETYNEYKNEYSGDVVVPQTVNYDYIDFVVTGVRDHAFDGCDNLRKLSLPSTIKTVGNNVLSSETVRELYWNSTASLNKSMFIEADAPTNMVVFIPAETSCDYKGNVVRNGLAEEIVLTDALPLRITSEFKAKRISYTRHFDKETVPHKPGGWESIILPFDVQSFMSEERGDIAPFNSGNSGAKPFMLAALTNNGFAVSSAMKANVPYIIAMPNCSVYDDEENISGEVMFYAESESGVKVMPTVDAGKSIGKKFDLVPAYEGIERDLSVYALNEESYNNLLPGSAFVSGLRDVRPFEAYASVESKPANAKTHFVIGGDGTATDIQRLYDSLFGSLKVECHNGVLYIFSSGVQTIGLYSSDGRLVRLVTLSEGMNTVDGLAQGIYFIGNKKVMIR